MEIGDDYENEITELLGQVERTLGARQHAMSPCSLRRTFKRIHDLGAILGEEINAKVGVNTLPNELVMDVFKHVLSDVDRCTTINFKFDKSTRVQTLPLLRLTHVCRRWRRVALANPILWQRIDCHDPEQLVEFALRRSHPGPLSLFINIPRYHESDRKDTLRSVLMHSDRLQRLDVAYGLRIEPALYSWLLDMRCPALECLTVSGYPPQKILTFAGSSVIVARRSLFCGGLSRLRALAICPIPDWLPENPLPALTHLYLSSHWHTDLRISTFLSFLGSAPALEVLHLSQFTMLQEYDEQDVVSAPAPLSRLKYIIFSKKSSFRSALALLGQLVIPASARTCLHSVKIAYNDNPVHLLSPFLSTLATGHLALQTNWNTLQVATEGPDSVFWLDGRHASDTDHAPTWLTQMPTMFPLSRLSHLQLHLQSTGAAVVRILHQAVSLRTLELAMCLYLDEHFNDGEDYRVTPIMREFDSSKDSLILVSRALCLEGSGGAQPVPLICPELRSLTLSLINCRIVPREFYTHWLDAIRSVLATRTHLGRPIRRLAVQPIDVVPEGMEVYDYLVDVTVPDEVLADYASLAEHVEYFVLHRWGEEPVAFPTPGVDYDVIGRYWTIPEHDRPFFDNDYVADDN